MITHNTNTCVYAHILEIAKQAYRAGSDYFYRVNDDTEFEISWPTAYVRACICPSIYMYLHMMYD